MVRSFVYFLLFIVIFLSGMLLGIDRERTAVHDDHSPTEEEWIIDEVKNEQHVSVPNNDNVSVIDMDEQSNITQKTAFFIETGVKGFYDVIVEILYQVSNLFM